VPGSHEPGGDFETNSNHLKPTESTEKLENISFYLNLEITQTSLKIDYFVKWSLL
jgi:hypothetical protein